jgi:hypothetical protein
MNSTLDPSSPTLREALYALSVAKEVPDAELLDAVVGRYPQYADDLTEFAIAIAVDALHGDADVEAAEAALDPVVISPVVSRALSRFQNRLYAERSRKDRVTDTGDHSPASVAPNPFATLSRDEFRAFARRLNANGVFVAKLRDRQIDPATMTPGFQHRVSSDLRVPVEAVVAHFVARQTAMPGREQFFKAEGKPAAGVRQTFEEAVRSSGLNEVQQRELLEL